MGAYTILTVWRLSLNCLKWWEHQRHSLKAWPCHSRCVTGTTGRVGELGLLGQQSVAMHPPALDVWQRHGKGMSNSLIVFLFKILAVERNLCLPLFNALQNNPEKGRRLQRSKQLTQTCELCLWSGILKNKDLKKWLELRCGRTDLLLRSYD